MMILMLMMTMMMNVDDAYEYDDDDSDDYYDYHDDDYDDDFHYDDEGSDYGMLGSKCRCSRLRQTPRRAPMASAADPRGSATNSRFPAPANTLRTV